MGHLSISSHRGASAAAAACLLAAAFAAADAQAETVVFSPGPEQTFIVPSGVTSIKVTAIGEKGEDNCPFGTCFQGKGEKATATLSVTPGEKLYADFVGAGGSSGGAAGRGGNAADLRTVPAAEAGSLASRVIVAGGGGGEGESEEGNVPGQGGNAGAAEGEAGEPTSPSSGGPGGGGSQSNGGSAGTAGGGTAGEAGQLGKGGHGGSGSPAGNAGGGGGGYYGGGGGGSGDFAGAGGGGGSSFIAAGAGEPSFALNSAESPAGITITYAGGTETVNFGAGGSEQSFVVPVGVSHIKVIAVGANGENLCECGAGMGEKVTASLPAKHGQRFFIDFVGGGFSRAAGSGGSAADLRTIARAEPGSLASRLLVAGGGGGSGIDEESSIGGSGGNAGFTEGAGGGSGEAGTGGGGGTQKNGGAAGKGENNGEPGQLGQGGSGGANSEGAGGGGGGGYYGGGGGAGGGGSTAGGGGGSGFVVAGAEEVSSALNGPKEQSSLSIIYKSAAPPTESITTPAEGARYSVGQGVTASFSCTEGSGGPGLLAGAEGCGGTAANGAAIDTSTAGEHSFTVTATSQDGLSSSKTVSYEVAAPPSVSVTTPAEGATYDEGQVVDASYSCTEGQGGPGLKPGSEGCSGPVAKGAPIDTSTGGKHEFTVTATSQDGQTRSETVDYTVTTAPQPPSVSITAPAEGATYGKGQAVDASYSCSEGAGGPGLKPGSEGCSGPVADGAAIDTSTAGEHEFTVTATSQDGQSSSKTVSYEVAAPPSVSVTTPAEGATYGEGEVVDASYSCSEGAGGPGLKPGSEGCSGPVADGAAIDTSTAGEHEFTVTATSQDGLTATKTVKYTVTAAALGPPDFGRCLKLAKGVGGNFKNGTCTVTAVGKTGRYEWVPGPGPSPGFSFARKASQAIALETTNGKALVCSALGGSGSITGLRTAEVTLVLSGCEDGGEQCTTGGTEGQVVLPFTGTLGWSDKARSKLDLELVPTSTIHYQCYSSGIPGTSVTLETDGILLPVPVDTNVKRITEFLTEKKGRQAPAGLEGEPPLRAEEIRLEKGKEERVGFGLRATLVQTYKERSEINASF